MISLGDEFMDRPKGEVVRRHQAYARAAGGRVLMVTFSRRSAHHQPTDFGGGFAVWPSASLAGFTFPLDAWRLAAGLALREKIDLVTTQDPFATALVGWMLKKRFGLPLMIQNHSCFIDNKLWIAERPRMFSALNRLAKFLLPRADGWRVVNRAEKNIYVDQLGLPSRKVRVLNAPVEVERFAAPGREGSRERIRARLGAGPDDPVLLWVGRPVKFKRLPVLLAAWRRLVKRRPNARPVLIGPAGLRQEDLAAEIDRHGLTGKLVWLDKGVSQTDLPDYYRAADIYFHSSDYEGFGRVMVEAGAAGLPVVATDTPGAREIIDHGVTGLLAPVDDHVALAEAGLRLMDDPVWARSLGRMASDKMVAQFDPEANTRAIVDLWQRTAAGWEGRS